MLLNEIKDENEFGDIQYVKLYYPDGYYNESISGKFAKVSEKHLRELLGDYIKDGTIHHKIRTVKGILELADGGADKSTLSDPEVGVRRDFIKGLESLSHISYVIDTYDTLLVLSESSFMSPKRFKKIVDKW